MRKTLTTFAFLRHFARLIRYFTVSFNESSSGVEGNGCANDTDMDTKHASRAN